MQSLGDRIKQKREELGLRQEDIAKLINVTQQAIQSAESGQTKKPRFLYELSKALKCDMGWLLSGKEESNIAPIILKSNKVPLISYVQAGLWTETLELRDSTGFEYILTSLDLSEHSFALTVKGKSMEPIFHEGDTIIVDPSIKPMPGDYVVAQNGEAEATFKKYKEIGVDEYERMQFELLPLNDNFPKLSSLIQQIRILGVVVEHRSYLKRI